jgi:hypothetical protein
VGGCFSLTLTPAGLRRKATAMTITLITKCVTGGAAKVTHIYEETLVSVVEGGNRRPATNGDISKAIAWLVSQGYTQTAKPRFLGKASTIREREYTFSKE